ncbi:hypothetical protein D0T49_13065 [Paludibacter sp. 221]|nr:hypothetical protein [Paludibacter sp. 221]
MDFLVDEISVFNNPIIISLGEPLIRQLLNCTKRDVKYYWDYIGNTKSGRNFKYIDAKNNYLGQRIFPLAHQPTCKKNDFYKLYLDDYLKFINETILSD